MVKSKAAPLHGTPDTVFRRPIHAMFYQGYPAAFLAQTPTACASFMDQIGFSNASYCAAGTLTKPISCRINLFCWRKNSPSFKRLSDNEIREMARAHDASLQAKVSWPGVPNVRLGHL
jgi:hypothetical protein